MGRRFPSLARTANVVLLTVGLAACRDDAAPTLTPAPLQAPTRELPFTLYFPGGDGRLHAETRTLQVGEAPAARAETIIATLLAGPRGADLLPPFAERVELAAATLSATGTLYLDLRGGPSPPGMGSTDEMLTVYSLVDTAAWNVPEARRVVLLWNGVQPESLAGHVDTARPLSPSKTLVAAP
jgi:hypothetical protein